MRDLEQNASVVLNADHGEQPAIYEIGRLSGRVQLAQIETIHVKNVASQVPRRNGQPLRAVKTMLNIRVQLPTFDVPDHPDSVVPNSLESVPRSSFRVNRTVCRKTAKRMKLPPKHPLPHSYLDRSSVALMRSCNSLSTSVPIAVSTGGVPTAYPHISRSAMRGGVSGSFPSATALKDDISALSPGRNPIHSFAKSPDLTIAGLRHGRNGTKGSNRRTWITEPQNNRIKSARAALEGETP